MQPDVCGAPEDRPGACAATPRRRWSSCSPARCPSRSPARAVDPRRRGLHDRLRRRARLARCAADEDLRGHVGDPEVDHFRRPARQGRQVTGVEMGKSRTGNFFEDFRSVCGGTRRRARLPRDQNLHRVTGSRAAGQRADTVARDAASSAAYEDLLVFKMASATTPTSAQTRRRTGLCRPASADARRRASSVASEVIGLRNSNARPCVVYVADRREPASARAPSWIRWADGSQRLRACARRGGGRARAAGRVEPGALSIAHFALVIGSVVHGTVCTHLWEDDAVGERIDHGSAMTW